METNPNLIKYILDGYTGNDWWTNIYKQVINNKKLGIDKILFFFILVDNEHSNSDTYFQPRPKSLDSTLCKLRSLLSPEIQPTIIRNDKLKLIFYFNYLTSICCLYIPPIIALKFLAIAYNKKHPSFFYYYKIIFRSCFYIHLFNIICNT